VTTEKTVDVLLFDLGGVLIDFAGFAELPRLLPGTPEPSAVRRRWIDSETVHVFERGDIGPGEFARRFVGEWDLELEPEAFLRELEAWARDPYEGATDLLEILRKDFRIACLSNSNELHTTRHRRAIGRYIDHQIFSNEVGLAKPDPEIFDLAIRTLEVPAHRIAFFDDTAVNVEVAAEAGMDAHLVDGIDELELCLHRIGILCS
jgi:HAD superfamily hydrolase (TIGR01509 family)